MPGQPAMPPASSPASPARTRPRPGGGARSRRSGSPPGWRDPADAPTPSAARSRWHEAQPRPEPGEGPPEARGESIEAATAAASAPPPMVIFSISAMAASKSKARTPRAIWRGTISFGMVSIPVNLYTATESHDVRFHLLHKRDGVRLKNVRWGPKDEKAVPWDEVVRGFEYAKGKYVPISEEDLDHLPVKTVHTVDISDFVKLEEVDPIYYDKAYYLAPEEAGGKNFSLLRQALEETGRAAVAKVAIRDKESLCLVRPYQDVLSMDTLFYANEIRSTKGIAVDGVGVSPKEIQMAISLIENLSDSFDAERYQDEYQAALKQVIDAKVQGAPLPQAPTEIGAKVVDLMEALRASVEQSKKKGGAAQRKASSAGRRTPHGRRKTA